MTKYKNKNLKEEILNLHSEAKKLGINTSIDLATIDMFIDKEDDIYSKFSFGTKRGINEEILKFLENEVHDIDASKGLIIKVFSNSSDSLISKKLEKAVRIKIASEVNEIGDILKSNRKDSFLWGFLGFSLLGIITYIESRFMIQLFKDIFIIISWVFLWRTIEMIFIERVSIKRREELLLHIYEAKFEKGW